MDRLPYELLVQIAQSLPKRDQLQWALVSHHWCEWLRNEYLFTEVHLHSPRKTYTSEPEAATCNDFLAFLDKGSYGNATRHITISGEPMQPATLLDMTRILPNIESVAWKIHPYVIDKESEEAICKWKHLRRIDESTSGLFTRSILASPFSAARLESITLKYLRELLYEPVIPSAASAISLDISHFINSPRLQHLTLDNAYINSDILASIHGHLQRLKSLKLYNSKTTYAEFEAFYPTSLSNRIAKVKNLDRISVTHIFAPQGIDQQFYFDIAGLMQFISNVYVDIVSFDFYVYPYHDPIPDRQETLRYLYAALHSWKRLKRYNCSFCPVDETVLQTMKENGIKLQELILYICEDLFPPKNIIDIVLSYPEVVENLTSLTIRQETYLDEDVDQSFMDLFCLLKHLDTLNSGAFRVSPDWIANALNRIPCLKHLYVEVISISINYLPKRVILTQTTQLVSIYLEAHIDDFEATDADGSVTQSFDTFNMFVENLLSHCPLLTSFKADIYPDIAESTLIFKNLEVVFSFKELPLLQNIKIATAEEKIHYKVTIQDETKFYSIPGIVNTGGFEFLEEEETKDALAYIVIIANKGCTIEFMYLT